MNELVTSKCNDVFTDSLVIEEGTSVRYDKVKEAIRKHKIRIEKFGKLSPLCQGKSSLNKMAYKDDGQLFMLSVKKDYSENPRTVVWVQEVE